MSARKERVRALLKSLETGDSAAAVVVHPQRYRQHNLSIADGLAGLGAALASLPAGTVRANTVRIFEDGDFVFAHTDYDFFGPKIGFDVFRFEGEHIVEHWDNLQPTPPGPNASGRTMIDGEVSPTDLHKTIENKALVTAFVDQVLVHGRKERIDDFLDGDDYRQHNPGVADGVTGLKAALQAMAAAGVSMRYDRIHRILGEGSFVLVMSEGEFGGQPSAFYDLFRVKGDKIAEHWDVIEHIPPRAEWKNDNGKF